MKIMRCRQCKSKDVFKLSLPPSCACACDPIELAGDFFCRRCDSEAEAQIDWRCVMNKLFKWILVIIILLAIFLLWGLYESPYKCQRIAEHYPILHSWCNF